MKKSIILSFMLFFTAVSALSADNKYAVMELSGSVNPIVAEYLTESIKKAADDGNQFIVIQMDTPGGLMDSMREIIKSILTSEIPVVVYTYPKGAQAASAGGFIMLASHVAVMAPGTEIGAMHPVSPMLDFMKKDRQGDPEGVMEKKVLNDTIAYARSLAQKRGRNVDWAVDAVSRAISNSYKEAYRAGVIDFIAEDMTDLIKKLNKRKIDLNGTPFIFKTENIREVKYLMTWKQRMVNKIADPQIIFLLFILAIAGISLEFKNPGMLVPGIIGGVSLVLFLLGIRIIPINVLGLLLVVLAFTLFVLELKFQSYGLLTIGGIVSFFLGATILFDSPLPGGGIPMSSIIAMIIVVLAFVFLVVRSIINVHRTQATTGREGMIGEEGIALSDFTDIGKISVHGEIWNAEFPGDVKKGDKLIVEQINGMTLVVIKKQ
ncbi:MAG TPA: nodulation protein NfeD [Spirochaetota bacterium]|nr:nodulation protein NfeD [Spirochaetota bacterium]HPJ33663.1 nodulation protein NfeD [Spirochaetota bacterium]